MKRLLLSAVLLTVALLVPQQAQAKILIDENTYCMPRACYTVENGVVVQHLVLGIKPANEPTGLQTPEATATPKASQTATLKPTQTPTSTPRPQQQQEEPASAQQVEPQSSQPTFVPTATPAAALEPTATATPTATIQAAQCSGVTVTGATFLQSYQGQNGTYYLYKVDSGATVRLVAHTNPGHAAVNWKVAGHSFRLANGGRFSFPNLGNSSVVDWTAPINTSVSAEGVDIRGDVSEDPWRHCPTLTFGVWPAAVATSTTTATATATTKPTATATATRT